MIRKRHIKGGKHIAPMDFADYLWKWDVLENSKVYYGRFYKMHFMKGIVTLVKVDEMYNILKSTSHCLLVERWDGNSKFFCRSYAHKESHL